MHNPYIEPTFFVVAADELHVRADAGCVWRDLSDQGVEFGLKAVPFTGFSGMFHGSNDDVEALGPLVSFSGGLLRVEATEDVRAVLVEE